MECWKQVRESGMKQDRAGGKLVAGFVLGLAGAVLDFYSGYQLTTQPGMMGAAQVWGIGVLLLGTVLAVTTLASLPGGSRRMKDFGGLMVVFGFAMLFIGVAMYLGYTSMMQAAVPSGVGMMVVGALMVANGTLMSRSRSMKPGRAGLKEN